MRDKRKPFFYKEKKRKSGPIAIILTFVAVFFFWIALVPTARQIFFPPLYPLYAYAESLVLRPRQPQTRDFLNQTVYEVPDLPDAEVIFAESLEALQSVLADDSTDGTADADGAPESSGSVAAPTPTAGISWVFVDQKDESGPEPDSEPTSISAGARLLTLPTFERADLMNDGPTALSTVLRFLNHTTNQYAIQAKLRPGYISAPVDLPALADYVAGNHPELSTLYRLNGSSEQLSAILDAGLPVIVPLIRTEALAAFRDDDRTTRRFSVVFGKDDAAGTVAVRDHARSDRLDYPTADFLGDWYAFGRAYFVVYRADQAEALTNALGEDWDERRNLERALEKFQTDVAYIPQNVFAWLNLTRACAALGRYGDALANFRSASNLKLPKRADAFYPFLYDVLFHSGYADELIAWADYGLKLNRRSPGILLWKGWGYVLRNENQEAEKYFGMAAESDPENPDVRYALQYLREYR